jgi:mannosyltransferase OCH1-like enzyme
MKSIRIEPLNIQSVKKHLLAKLIVVVLAVSPQFYLLLNVSKDYSSEHVKIVDIPSIKTYEHTWDSSLKDTSTGDAIEPPLQTKWLISPDFISRQYVNSSDLIPKAIHKVYISKHGGMPNFEAQPGELRAAHQSWKELNPGYEMQYFDLVTARKYLLEHFHPVFLRAFDCIQAFSGKANLFRLIIVYREGGWYSDWKEVCLVDRLLEKLTATNRDLVVVFWDVGLPISRQGKFVMNSFFGASPKHPCKYWY